MVERSAPLVRPTAEYPEDCYVHFQNRPLDCDDQPLCEFDQSRQLCFAVEDRPALVKELMTPQLVRRLRAAIYMRDGKIVMEEDRAMQRVKKTLARWVFGKVQFSVQLVIRLVRQLASSVWGVFGTLTFTRPDALPRLVMWIISAVIGVGTGTLASMVGLAAVANPITAFMIALPLVIASDVGVDVATNFFRAVIQTLLKTIVSKTTAARVAPFLAWFFGLLSSYIITDYIRQGVASNKTVREALQSVVRSPTVTEGFNQAVGAVKVVGRELLGWLVEQPLGTSISQVADRLAKGGATFLADLPSASVVFVDLLYGLGQAAWNMGTGVVRGVTGIFGAVINSVLYLFQTPPNKMWEALTQNLSSFQWPFSAATSTAAAATGTTAAAAATGTTAAAAAAAAAKAAKASVLDIPASAARSAYEYIYNTAQTASSSLLPWLFGNKEAMQEAKLVPIRGGGPVRAFAYFAPRGLRGGHPGYVGAGVYVPLVAGDGADDAVPPSTAFRLTNGSPSLTRLLAAGALKAHAGLRPVYLRDKAHVMSLRRSIGA